LVEQKHKGWDLAAARSISCEQNPSLVWKGNAASASVGATLLCAEKSPDRICLNKPHAFHLVLKEKRFQWAGQVAQIRETLSM